MRWWKLEKVSSEECGRKINQAFEQAEATKPFERTRTSVLQPTWL